MKQPHSTEIRHVPLEKIKGEDRFFAVSPPWFPIGVLLEAIGRAGIVTPLRVQASKEGVFRIVSGFRRCAAAAQMRLEAVPCVVAAEDETPLDLFIQALMDNLGSRPLHRLEKGIALLKLKNQFQIPDEVLVDQYLGLMDSAPTRFLLRQLIDLATLPELLQKAFFDGLEADLALGLSRWKEEEQVRFLELLSAFKPGRNRQKELFTLLDELRAIGHRSGSVDQSIRALLERAQVADVQSAEKLSSGERFQVLLERLREVRFPRLVKHEKRHAELRKVLRIPPEIQLNLPRFFEGRQAAVTFSFSTRREFKERIERLRELAERDELDDLLDLL
jgi:ParB-like chromosome segregation protein Spo0J